MRPRRILWYLLTFAMLLPSIASASNWIQLGQSRQNGMLWYYDRDSVAYSQDKKLIGIDVPVKDKNFQKMWIKSSADNVEVRYEVELNCKERSARMKDDRGKNLYSEPSIDYLYEKPIPPDTLLDLLRKAVCK